VHAGRPLLGQIKVTGSEAPSPASLGARRPSPQAPWSLREPRRAPSPGVGEVLGSYPGLRARRTYTHRPRLRGPQAHTGITPGARRQCIQLAAVSAYKPRREVLLCTQLFLCVSRKGGKKDSDATGEDDLDFDTSLVHSRL
jgi:hypothetical protein